MSILAEGKTPEEWAALLAERSIPVSVRTPQHCGNIPESHGQRGFVTVTLPRMPWEQEITAPDPREETKPRRNPAAPPARAYRKQPAPPPGVMDGGDFA